MFGKQISDIVMWIFLASVGVLILTHGSGFNTAVGTLVKPVEYESTLIATAGGSGSVPNKSVGYPS